jgi:peroxin-19
MADLIGELESSPEMQKQFEEMMRELGAAAETEIDAQPGSSSTGAESSRSAPPPAGDKSFQESIRKTMDRMQHSGEAASAAAANSSQADMDFMADLLRQMETDGAGSEDDFSKMLLEMMEQLTDKEILYEPMKELHDKFPDWMEKNKATTSAEDMARYEEQQKNVAEIVAKFEDPGFSNDKVEYRQYIVDRMHKVGSPSWPCPNDLDLMAKLFPDASCRITSVRSGGCNGRCTRSHGRNGARLSTAIDEMNAL